MVGQSLMLLLNVPQSHIPRYLPSYMLGYTHIYNGFFERGVATRMTLSDAACTPLTFWTRIDPIPLQAGAHASQRESHKILREAYNGRDRIIANHILLHIALKFAAVRQINLCFHQSYTRT